MSALIYVAFLVAACYYGYARGHWYGIVSENLLGRATCLVSAAAFAGALILNIFYEPGLATAIFSVIATYFWAGTIARINSWVEEHSSVPLYYNSTRNAVFMGRCKYESKIADLYVVTIAPGSRTFVGLFAQFSNKAGDCQWSRGGACSPWIEEAQARASERGYKPASHLEYIGYEMDHSERVFPSRN